LTTVSNRALSWRDRLPLRPGDPLCGHSQGYYREHPPGTVTRSCRHCGTALGPPEARCSSWVQVGREVRQCLGSGRFDGRCRVHRVATA
jgi:hypothetical protein